MKGLQVLVSGSGMVQESYSVNVLEAGLELKQSLEAGWRQKGFIWVFDPREARGKWRKGREWRLAQVVRIIGEPEPKGANGVQSQQIAKRGW